MWFNCTTISLRGLHCGVGVAYFSSGWSYGEKEREREEFKRSRLMEGCA